MWTRPIADEMQVPPPSMMIKSTIASLATSSAPTMFELSGDDGKGPDGFTLLNGVWCYMWLYTDSGWHPEYKFEKHW